MSDGKGIEEKLTEEAKELAVEVYRDGLKPAVQEVGGTLTSAVRLLLTPVNAVLNGAKAALDRLGARLSTRLEKVPPERQIAAPPTIAAPAALQYVLLGESDDAADLREMFENLLLASMDRDTVATVHPSFVTMISQLTQDEAWILKSIDRDDYYAYDVVDTDRSKLGIHSMVGVGIVDDEKLVEAISNLLRLGILATAGIGPTDSSDQKRLNEYIEERYGDRKVTCHGMSIRVTPVGQRFLATCVVARP